MIKIERLTRLGVGREGKHQQGEKAEEEGRGWG